MRGPVEVHRLALNMDQVEGFGLPPNPAKLSDARAASYIARFGYESWELDAIEPSVLVGLVTDAVAGLRDDERYRARQRRECRMRLELKDFLENTSDKRPHDYDDPENYEEPGDDLRDGIYENDAAVERDCREG